jgi:hypothetical protein
MRPYHGHIDQNQVLTFFKNKEDIEYKCHQVLKSKKIDKNAESISLFFYTTLNSDNQYFSARLKTDEKYDY